MMNLFYLIPLILVSIVPSSNSIQKLKIGGIFNTSEENEEIAFRHAVKMSNSYNQRFNLFLATETIFVDTSDVLRTSKAACQILQSQVVAIFGPSSSISSRHVQSMCDAKEMPNVETHWDTRKPYNFERNLINLHPHPQTLAKVYVDIVRSYGWKRFTILFDTEESLAQIDELLTANEKEFQVQIKQLDLDNSWSYRTVLNMIKKSGEVNFVIACDVNVLGDFLLQAQHIGLITERFNYLVMNLDMHTLDLVAYQYAGCNITGVRLLDPELNDVIEVADSLSRIKQQLGKPVEIASHLAAWKINVKTALLIDAVSMFYETLKDFQEARKFEAKSLYCNATDNWEHGYSLINNMKTRIWSGMTGPIKFDHHGVRSEFLLDVVELTEGGLIKIGTWNSTDGLNISRSFREDPLSLEEEGVLQNKSFTVITALTEPYGFLKETTTQLSGNDRFEGFGIDLIHELSLMLGFNYTFVIQEDGANGNYNRETKQWNGMIREIIDERAHLAITDLTITSERQGAVDFTMPFMNLGISILYRKPEPVPPSLFTFASPFSIQVWMLLGVAYLFVTFSLFIIGRICPSEWTNPYPCVEEPEFLINQFTLKNSLWFTIGSLMQQGSEIAPIGISTRMVAGIWWFFTLIMVSSYTANLAAFLTIETLVTSFKNIDELAQQKEIKYGAKADGATSNFFRDSDLETYKIIWKHMYRYPDEMTTDNDIGVRRVENENYAFLMESTTIEYMVERHCTLAQVGGLLDDKGYGIAMKKDSKLRNILSAAVLKLQETGKLTALKIKWWKEKRGGGNCASGAAGGTATPLDLKNVEGVFFILTVGTILGFLGTFVELAVHLLYTNYKNKRKLNENFKETYIDELRFICRFKERVKRVQYDKTEVNSVQDSVELMQGRELDMEGCNDNDQNIIRNRKKSNVGVL